MKLRIILIILAAIIMSVIGTLQQGTFIPTNPWEHYCKYYLHKNPKDATSEEYTYYLDCFSGGDEYEQIQQLYNK